MAPQWSYCGIMKRLSLRLPDNLHQQAATAAAENERSLNFLITAALRDFLKNRTHPTTATKEQQ